MAIPSNQKNALLSEINVTPFVDVMLVLLIIFMVTAPMLQQGIPIKLPETKNTGVKVSKTPFILKIGADKKVYIASQAIPLNNLQEKLAGIFEHKSSKVIYLQADKSIPYGMVAEVLGEIKSSGVYQVSLITLSK